MDAALTQLVWERARQRCEYCQMPQDLDEIRFEIDHIFAIKYDGLTVAGNLALSCFHDNSHKGSNIAGLDPKTGILTPLFNPRRYKWHTHFRWQGVYLLGRAPLGRVDCTENQSPGLYSPITFTSTRFARCPSNSP
jgi:HNH endonuclease